MTLFKKIDMTNKQASQLLEDTIQQNRKNQDTAIPLRNDGTEYTIKDLQEDQKQSIAEVLFAIRRYCNGEDVNSEKVLRVTLSGVAGSGKSTWINTLVTHQ
jgi:ribosome biogenesis GTPase A